MFFYRFASGGSARTDFNISNETCVQQMSKPTVCIFLICQIRRTRNAPILNDQKRFLNTSADPPDPVDPMVPDKMEHELRLATHQQRAVGQDDGSLNKLFQITF